MLKFLTDLFTLNIVVSDKNLIDDWLADSTDLVDLERRQRMIENGQAPWQLKANHNLKGWI